MYKYLPSRKFILITLSIIIALGIVYFSVFFKKGNKLAAVNQAVSLKQVLTQDSDSDGVQDWEETLWKTDSKNPDTDGDGTTDGVEIKSNRDPLKANTALTGQVPNDKIEQSVIDAREKTKVSTSTYALNATEQMGRDLLTGYLNNKKVNSSLTQEEIQTIIEKTLADLPEIDFKTFTEGDIITTSASDNESLRVYSNKIAEIILNNMKEETETVDSIINDAAELSSDKNLESQIKIVFKRFDPLVAKNQKSVSSLLEMKVPKVLISEHLNLLNTFERIYQSLDLMQNSSDNTAILVLVKNNYPDTAQSLVDSILELTKKLSSLKVNFLNEKDYGYQFFNVIILKE